jgi:hypothetical protein
MGPDRHTLFSLGSVNFSAVVEHRPRRHAAKCRVTLARYTRER